VRFIEGKAGSTKPPGMHAGRLARRAQSAMLGSIQPL